MSVYLMDLQDAQKEGKLAKGIVYRLIQYLLTLVPDENELVNLIVKEMRRRDGSEANLLFGRVFNAIVEIRTSTENDKIHIAKIRKALDDNVTSKRIGITAVALGFKRTRDSNGERCIAWDEEVYERLKEEYLTN